MNEPTYTIHTIGVEKAITCHRCNMTSRHSQDVENLYCGMCKRFHQRQPTGDALLIAATDLLNVLTLLRYPDPAALWRLGGIPLENAYQALKHAVADEARRAAAHADDDPPF